MENIIINKNEALPRSEDYPFLREQGLQYIQGLSRKVWTDYNIHDPGVTILELLCYAITDLGYRTNFPIADLLTPSGATSPEKSQAFYTARDILTTHPVTPNDYRRLIIEKVPGIKNIWMEPTTGEAFVEETGGEVPDYRTANSRTQVYADKRTCTISAEAREGLNIPIRYNGLWRVKIELEDRKVMNDDPILRAEMEAAYPGLGNLSNASDADIQIQVVDKVRETLHENRNLCEDFETISVLRDEEVALCSEIEVSPETDINELIKKIYRAVYNYISPSLNFYSLEEMLNRGKSIEEIFEGTVPEKGFVDEEELRTRLNSQRRVIYTSDIINILMDLPGVIAVKSLSLTSIIDGAIINSSQEYCLHLSDPVRRSFRLISGSNNSLNKPLNRITFYKGPLPLQAREPDIVLREVKRPLHFTGDLPIPGGSYRELKQYYPVQNEFPRAWNAGKEMLEYDAEGKKFNLRMQLKGYLIFFDQLLANFLAQLNHAPNLFSWKTESNQSTYSNQPLFGTPQLEYLIHESLEGGIIDGHPLQETFEPEALRLDRRNRFLDHLLARFNESFTEYSVFKFTHQPESLSVAMQENLISDKISFLKEYPLISRDRSHAFNINRDAIYTENISGFQRRITRALGLDVYRDHYLAKVMRDPDDRSIIIRDDNGMPIFYDIAGLPFDEVFGLHVIEHILLRPLNWSGLSESLNICCCGHGEASGNDLDPFSMRMTVVLPGWLDVSMNMDFRRFVEEVIRLNAPAHVTVKICWVGMVQMFEYEYAYENFLQYLALRDYERWSPRNFGFIRTYGSLLSELCHVINNLRNVYPPAILHDCEGSETTESGDLAYGTVLLNRTSVGTVPDNITIVSYPLRQENTDDFNRVYTQDFNAEPEGGDEPSKIRAVKKPLKNKKAVAKSPEKKAPPEPQKTEKKKPAAGQNKAASTSKKSVKKKTGSAIKPANKKNKQ